MNRRRLNLAVLALGLWLAGTVGALAQPLVTEVIPLQYRTVEEILPVLRPLVPPPGGISGMAGQLVLRTTRENLEEIRGVLATLDSRPRMLLISVRHADSAFAARREAEAFGRVERGRFDAALGRTPAAGPGLVVQGRGDGERAGARVLDTQRERQDRAEQSLRVLEGREAFIQAGESVPVGERRVIVSGGVATVLDSVGYREAGTGFYVVPRLRGDSVLLEISPHRSRFARGGGGTVQETQATTTITAPLGQWVELGASDQHADEVAGGTLYSTRKERDQRQRIEVRVELLAD